MINSIYIYLYTYVNKIVPTIDQMPYIQNVPAIDKMPINEKMPASYQKSTTLTTAETEYELILDDQNMPVKDQKKPIKDQIPDNYQERHTQTTYGT